jgi:hypothetical protein
MSESIPLHQWYFRIADENKTPDENDFRNNQDRANLEAITETEASKILISNDNHFGPLHVTPLTFMAGLDTAANMASNLSVSRRLNSPF